MCLVARSSVNQASVANPDFIGVFQETGDDRGLPR